MADSTEETRPVPPSTPPPRRRRRWGRTLLLIALIVVLGLALLVAIAPTLLSTGPAVHFALGKVNAELNGHVEVNGVSLGWLGGARLDGVRVFDQAGTQIAQADHVVCPMPLWHAVTGSYPLGNTVVDGLAFDAKYDSQGRLNFAQLVKTTPGPTPPPRPAGPPPAAKPSKLPDVSGDVQLKNARGTVSQPGKPTVYLTALAAEVKIPGIDQPITDHVDASVKVGDGGPVGHLVADGTAAAIKANVVDLDTAAVHQTADLTDLDLAAAQPFIPATVGVTTLAGLLDGHLLVDVADGKSATVDGTLTAKQKVVVGGPALHGDQFTTDTFAAAIPKLTGTFPDGLGHWQSGRLTTADPISLKVDPGQLTLVLDVVPQSVLNLGDGKAPGSAGRVDLTGHFDLAKLAGQLPHTAHLSDGTSLTRGTLDQSVKVALTPDRGTATVESHLTDVAGTRTVDGHPQPVTLEPVDLTAGVADVGGGSLLNGLRDLSLKLNSSFANADFHGATVGDLTGTLTAHLQAAQAEAAQLIDFGGMQVAGDVNVNVTSDRKPTQDDVKLVATVKDLKYADAAGPRVAEPLVTMNLSAAVHGTDTATVQSITDGLLTLTAGPADAPSVDVALAVPSATLGDSPSADFQLTKLMANLPQLQQQFANVPAGQVGTVVGSGTLTGVAAGHYGQDGVRLDPSTFAVDGLTLQRQLADGQKVTALDNDTVNVAAAGQTTLGATKTIDVVQLSVADTAKLFDVHKGAGPLTLTSGPDGVGGSGQVAVAADLGAADAVVRKLGQTTAQPAPAAEGIKSGHLSGTLDITAAAAGNTDVNGHFTVPDLNVTTPSGDTGPQMATVIVKAAADRSAHTVTVDNLSLQSLFATATLSNGSVLLSSPTTVGKLRKADVAVDVPDVRVLAALAEAFSTPAPAPKAGETPTPPLHVTAGRFSMRANVANDGTDLTLAVPTLTADGLAFTRGTASYGAKPISAHLAATVGEAADGKTMMDQLRGLKVTQLDATSGVGTLTMTTPITVADLSNPAASAAGGVKVDGELADLAALAAAYGAKPADAYPYRGHYTMTEDLTGGTGVTAKGGLTVAKFQVLQGQQVQFAEDQLAVANDVSVAGDLNSATVKSASIAMRSSGALDVSITDGTVIDFAHARALHLPVQAKYDLAKLWPIIHPMLIEPGKPDGYADVKLAGTFTKQWLVGGSYPAGVTPADDMRAIQVDADLAVADFEHSGLVVKDLDVPVTVRNGLLVTSYPDGHAAPAATANDGKLDLSALTVDLTQTPYRLTTPASKAALTRATINPLFSQTFLAQIINNPIFAGAQQATGLIDFTVDSCHDLPLGDLLTQAVPANTGTAAVRFSLTDLHIGLQGLGAVSTALKADSFEANIKDGTVAVAKGISTQHVKFVTGSYTIAFDGNVRLADEAFVPMTVTVPLAKLVEQAGVHDANSLKYVPDTARVPVKGTVHNPDYSAVLGVVANAFKDAAVKGGLGDLLGGGKGKGGDAKQNPADALGGFLNGLGKKKK